jgi:UDP-N-acetylglucosamine 2-epimerase (non-hydrolysing)
LKIPKPNYFLNVGSGSHAYQTARSMERIEKVLLKEKPDLVIVVGDVNSTLAGAITAAKLHIPIAHIEAGQRSFDREMPEEINRILVDHVSDFLFASTEHDKKNLIKEGIDRKKIFFVGNIMTDTLLKIKSKASAFSNPLLRNFKISRKKYGVMTIHRAGNVDNYENFKNILKTIKEISNQIPIIFPIHPRTQKMIRKFRLGELIKGNPNLIIIPPISYIEMINLVWNSRFVLTDSGGLQHETTVLNIPCLTVKKTTEWPITIDKGTNVVVGLSRKKIVRNIKNILLGKVKKRKK